MSDLVGFLRDEHPYKWALMFLALCCTGLILLAFYYDGKDESLLPQPTIIYAESWRADRSDVEILEQLKKDVARREAYIQKRTREFQKAADLFGIDYKEDAARETAARKAEEARIQMVLDKRIEIARAQLQKKKQGAETPIPQPIVQVGKP